MEALVHETYDALLAQTEALAKGTNPIVYLPAGTQRIPDCPLGATAEVVDGAGDGAGIYFYNPKFVRREEIHNAVKAKTLWLLLGFVQSKSDAIKGGLPALVVARTAKGKEIKSAVVDSRNARAVVLQKMVFERQFPDSVITLEMPQTILLERMFSSGEAV